MIYIADSQIGSSQAKVFSLEYTSLPFRQARFFVACIRNYKELLLLSALTKSASLLKGKLARGCVEIVDVQNSQSTTVCGLVDLQYSLVPRGCLAFESVVV